MSFHPIKGLPEFVAHRGRNRYHSLPLLVKRFVLAHFQQHVAGPGRTACQHDVVLNFPFATSALPPDPESSMAQAGGITAVIYWSHAWVAQREGTAEQELEVVWLEASGRRVRGRDGIVATNTMVSWLAPAAALLPAPGEWSIEVRMGGVLVGTRPFYICSAACEGISAQAAQRYFRAAAPARGQAAERGASRT